MKKQEELRIRSEAAEEESHKRLISFTGERQAAERRVFRNAALYSCAISVPGQNGLFNQCSLRFSLCSDVEVECKGAADETSVLYNMPLLGGPKNTRDLAKSMWKLLEFDNSSI